MSRSGYSDDIDDNWSHIRWRGTVASAIRGKRGQAFLREMRGALDAMPEKKLVAMHLQSGESVCAIGSVGMARGIDMSSIDPENCSQVGAIFDIADPMVQEIVYMNDEYWDWETEENGAIKKDEAGNYIRLTEESRWKKMRKWVDGKITETPS